VNLLKSVTGDSWGAHPSYLILLYRGLIGSVLKYGSVCFTNMAKTHMLGLERVQYRALRIALGLMGSTPNNCLGVFGGILQFAEKFAYLNFRYLVAAFYRLGHPLSERHRVLGALNMGRCIREYFDVLSLDIVPSESFTQHMDRKLSNVQEAMYSLVAPCELLTVTSGYSLSCTFYTDGFIIEGCVGFAVHQNFY
jgi:hypothetical protein